MAKKNSLDQMLSADEAQRRKSWDSSCLPSDDTLGRENGVRNHTVKRLALAAGIFLVAVALSASAHAGSLRQGSTGGGGAVTGSLPGQVLWTYYQTLQDGQYCPPDGGPEDTLCNTAGIGDNIFRLINPNGSANPQLGGGQDQPVCAMIYVFDDDQEMGECCGCPLSPSKLATFSVEHNLTSNWGLQRGPEGGDHGIGAIAIVATAPNVPSTCLGQSVACNGGCDPTSTPGYSVTTANNLLGSMTHSAEVGGGGGGGRVTEVGLSDDAGGDPTNLSYLQTQCGALVGNGTGGAICNCGDFAIGFCPPTEIEPLAKCVTVRNNGHVSVTVDFGKKVVGGTARQTWTLSLDETPNYQGVFDEVTINSDQAKPPFDVEDPLFFTNVTVFPGEKHKVKMRFRPTAVSTPGMPFEGAFTIVGKKSGTIEVHLKGTGI